MLDDLGPVDKTVGHCGCQWGKMEDDSGPPVFIQLHTIQ